jgi:hypothetical protein
MGFYRAISVAAFVILLVSSVLTAGAVVWVVIAQVNHWSLDVARYKNPHWWWPIFVLCALMAYFVWQFANGRDRDRVLRTGAPAEAQILEVRNGAYSKSSGRTQAKLLLEVHPEGRASFQARAELWVGVGDARLLLSPGQRLQVFIDPDDPSRVAVPRSVSLMP